MDPAVVLVDNSGNTLGMYGQAVALVYALFLSPSALLTRSSFPSPRARVCTFWCARVRVDIGIPEVSSSACLVIFYPAWLRLPPRLPFVVPSSLPSMPSPSFPYDLRPSSVCFRPLWVFFCVPLGLAVVLCLSFVSTSVISTLAL